MTQSKEELEQWHSVPDAWNYLTTKDDRMRKRYIIQLLRLFAPFSRALDVGAAEGWITQDLPAPTRHAIEISDNAAARFPDGVRRVKEPEGIYDLVIATGVLYNQYEAEQMLDHIRKAANGFILTCHIKDWERLDIIAKIPGKQIFMAEFPYREYVQKLRIFNVSISSHR